MSLLEGRHIIFDTDMGPDDAWALILLLKAMQYLNFELLGITCTYGNSNLENVAINTLRVLEVTNRLDIPVYLGATNGFVHDRDITDPYWGQDGFGDVEYETKPNLTLIQSENAINAMYRLAKEGAIKNQKITLICIGPLTNLALTIRTYPDFVDYIEEIYIMGGTFLGQGNVSPTAEFNFYQDPESVHVVLNKSKSPITVLPWETASAPLLSITSDWRFNVLGQLENKLTKLLNPAEKIFKNFEHWTPCDGIISAILLNPTQMIEQANDRHVFIELNGQWTRGMMIIDHFSQKPANVKIIEKINQATLENMLLWVIGHDIKNVQSIIGV